MTDRFRRCIIEEGSEELTVVWLTDEQWESRTDLDKFFEWIDESYPEDEKMTFSLPGMDSDHVFEDLTNLIEIPPENIMIVLPRLLCI